VLEAAGVRVPVGSVCDVRSEGQPPVLAEVVGFDGDRAFLMPTGEVHGLASGARVSAAPGAQPPPRFGRENHPWRRSEDRGLHLPMGDGLLGRVVDSHGEPMDRQGPLPTCAPEPMVRRPINAMDRDPVRQPLDTGVRAINAMLTVGRGQRIGLFAGTGVGKSVLLGMMARYTAGRRDRGRPDRRTRPRGEGVHRGHPRRRGPGAQRGRGRTGRRAAAGAHAGRHLRHRDRRALPRPRPHVLLLMDSLTRYAMAQREIALAIGEPPATKGYPPSCFAKLPQLVERSGNGLAGVGSITAFYTVLSEGDDPQDPIADAARGILDGHIVLSRELAEAATTRPSTSSARSRA
jgi:flagellum-specific ATP synthase